MARVIKTRIETKEVIDKSTGEVLGTTIEQKYSEPEPEFAKMYLNDLHKILNVPKALHTVSIALLPYLNYKGQLILNKTLRKEIAESIKIKSNSFDHALVDLIKNDILFQIGTNHYEFNPYFFAKGSWKEIKALRMDVTYTAAGKYIKIKPDTQASLFE